MILVNEGPSAAFRYLVPAGDLPAILYFFWAAITSPIVIISAVLVGLLARRMEWVLFLGAFIGMGTQTIPVIWFWETMPPGLLEIFLRSGLIGTSLAGMVWASIGFGIMRLFSREKPAQ